MCSYKLKIDLILRFWFTTYISMLIIIGIWLLKILFNNFSPSNLLLMFNVVFKILIVFLVSKWFSSSSSTSSAASRRSQLTYLTKCWLLIRAPGVQLKRRWIHPGCEMLTQTTWKCQSKCSCGTTLLKFTFAFQRRINHISYTHIWNLKGK